RSFGATDDSPEISRSVGVKGGIVILWPRLIPKDDPHLRDIGGKVQKRLADLAKTAFPDAPIDVRPEPERVCPRSGCDGITLGVVIKKKDEQCAAAALVAKSGQSETQIVP